jgi:hypothetical protein
LSQNIHAYVGAVHRLTDYGAVIAASSRGTSHEGFDFELRMIDIFTFEGDRIDRCELFDETDLDAALARFDELCPRTKRLNSAAVQVYERFWDNFAARDWDAITNSIADDIRTIDHRRVVNAGVQQGRDVEIENMRALAEVGAEVTATVIATRGERLALGRMRSSNRDLQHGEFGIELLNIIEINIDNRISASALFDPDDVDAAYEELDARYLAGEAAAYAKTWSAIAKTNAVFRQGESAPTTEDLVYVDHRLLRAPLDAKSQIANVRAAWDLTPTLSVRIAAVHRLSRLGGVLTHIAHGTSQDGFDAEWHDVILLTFDGDLIDRCELFDETDLDAALARFSELDTQKPHLENVATGIYERFKAYFTAHDWTSMSEIMAIDMATDDRRRVVNAGARYGRDVQVADIRALSEVGSSLTSTTVATRGNRLALVRARFSGREQGPQAFHGEYLCIIEVDADGLLTTGVVFDLDDIAASYEELDDRYLAGEAAVYANTWSTITEAYAATNRRESPATTPDWIAVDHRRLQRIERSNLDTYLSATWDLAPDISFQVEAVHRLRNVGCAVTRTATGTSQAGFRAEWRQIDVFTVEGDKISRLEVFDEADLDAALARFDELNTQKPKLENAASQLDQRFWKYFAARNWDGIAAIADDDICIDDRRRVVNAGVERGRDAHLADVRAIAEVVGNQDTTSTVIATRGDRLALTRVRSLNSELDGGEVTAEVLCMVEVSEENRTTARIGFDIEDLDSAFAELDARYLAGEAADHAQTWSIITGVYTGFNRRKPLATTPDLVAVDHRPVVTIDVDEISANVEAVLNQLPNLKTRIEAVHRLTHLGAVVSHLAYGVSQEGFEAEWRMIFIFTVDGDLVSRYEFFDETDLDAALARFDELSQPGRE